MHAMKSRVRFTECSHSIHNINTINIVKTTFKIFQQNSVPINCNDTVHSLKIVRREQTFKIRI